jgi:hypothetical protein
LAGCEEVIALNNDAMSLLSAGALLPHSIGAYIALMGAGFGVAILGHLAGSRWLVAVGVIMIMLAVLIFPLALQVTTEPPPQPGPKVPLALLAALA